MLDKLIPMLIVVVGAAGGTYGGQMMKAPADTQSTADKYDEAEKKDDGHGEKSSHDSDEKADKGHGSDDGYKTTKSDKDASYYYSFSREFVVPVMQGERVKSLVILNISLEADPSMSSKLFSQDPKLRDNIMTTLVQLSSETTVLENLTEVESYETIRTMVLRNLDDVISSGLHNVLILDVGKQDL